MLNVDQLMFLRSVCDGVFRSAEAWEAQHQESERQAVRTVVEELKTDIGGVAQAIGRSHEAVLNDLLDAALHPLKPEPQAGVKVLYNMWAAHKAMQERWERQTAEVLAEALREMSIDSPYGGQPHNIQEGTDDNRATYSKRSQNSSRATPKKNVRPAVCRTLS